jgi:hypothetical protein
MTNLFREKGADEIRAVARRQLVGSIVAGILVVVFASLNFLSSMHSPAFIASAHGGVQRPVFVTPSEHIVASVKQKLKRPDWSG